MHLSHLVAEYIQTLKVRNFARQTIEARSAKLARFLTYLADRAITEAGAIGKDVIADYQTEIYHALNFRGRPNCVEYQNTLLGAVKGFMRFLKERDYIVSDPARNIPYAKLPKRLPRSVLTESEVRKIIKAPDMKSVIGYRDKTIMEVLYTTGIRCRELINLTLPDVDYRDGLLRVNNGKGGKDRVVPLGKIACRHLESYIQSVRPELIRDPYNNHLFLSTRGKRISDKTVLGLIKKYAKKAKLKKNVSPHTFRHTCATVMLKNRADIRAVQEILGHESLESTQIYTHLTINDLKETHKRCHPREKDKE